MLLAHNSYLVLQHRNTPENSCNAMMMERLVNFKLLVWCFLWAFLCEHQFVFTKTEYEFPTKHSTQFQAMCECDGDGDGDVCTSCVWCGAQKLYETEWFLNWKCIGRKEKIRKRTTQQYTTYAWFVGWMNSFSHLLPIHLVFIFLFLEHFKINHLNVESYISTPRVFLLFLAFFADGSVTYGFFSFSSLCLFPYIYVRL